MQYKPRIDKEKELLYQKIIADNDNIENVQYAIRNSNDLYNTLKAVYPEDVKGLKALKTCKTYNDILRRNKAKDEIYYNESLYNKFQFTPKNIIDSQLYFDFSDNSCYIGSGTNINDISGNNRNGTIIGTVNYNNGNLLLNGIDTYIRLNQMNFQQTCISFCFYIDSTSPTMIVPIRQGHNPINFSLYINNGTISYFLNGSISSNITDSFSFNPYYNKFINLVLCTDWINNEIKLYINGELKSINSFNAGTYVFNNTTQSYTYTDISRNVNNANSFIKGYISNFIIYNKILTNNEIFNNYLYLNNKYKFDKV